LDGKKDRIFDRSFRIEELGKKKFSREKLRKKKNLFCMIKNTYGVAA
jgi:hypothetical protein